jgi:hypothetical protein
MSETTNDAFLEVEPMSIDQLAGGFVMIAGAIGSLLLVIWQSKCHCKMNLCYIFSCERRPPNEEEMKSLKDQAKELKKKGKESKNKDVETPEDDSPKPLSRSNSIKISEFTTDEDYKKRKLQEDYLRQKPETEPSVMIP